MSRGRYRIHEFENGMYPPHLFVMVDDRLDFFSGNFKHTDGTDIDTSDIPNTAAAFTHSAAVEHRQEGTWGFAIVFLGRQEMTARNMAHEAYHATCFYADNLGLQYQDGGNNEEFAYLMGWIMNCLDIVKKGAK